MRIVKLLLFSLFIEYLDLPLFYLFIDTIDSHHHHQQQQLAVPSSTGNNLSMNNNLTQQTTNSCVTTQLKTSASKQSIINSKKTHEPMVMNMPPETNTFVPGSRFPINNSSSFINKQIQHPIRTTNTNKTTTSTSNNSHYTTSSIEPVPTAFDLMSTRLIQSERNRKIVGKNNPTNKNK